MSFFAKLFGKGGKIKSVIGIDLGSSSLKVVQLRRDRGAAVLETYGELALGPYTGAEAGQATNLSAARIAETLSDLLREANVTTTDAGISIPFSRSLLTLVELPYREDPDEQRTIIEFEARKYIPVPVSEVQLDWFVVPDPTMTESSEAPKKVKVLLVAVHNDQLALLENVMRDSGLTASFYEIEIFSTIRSVVNEAMKPILVLDIGASATKVYVVERGVIARSHHIPRGGQDVTRAIATANNMSFGDAERLKKEYGFLEGHTAYDRRSIELGFSRILEEARRPLMQFESSRGEKIETLVLTGGGAVTKGLKNFAKTIFAMDVQVADPFAKTQAPAFMSPVLKDIGPEFAVAVGLALRKLEEGV